MEDKKVYFVGLDKWRFYAFLLVFWQHTGEFIFEKLNSISIFKEFNFESIQFTGGIGVQFFFVLSGFLITFLLLRETENYNKINLGSFYLRRILRIWPLYYLILFCGVYFLPFVLSSYQFQGDIFKTFFFLNNIDVHNQTMVTGITWSVAIEEQFYLIWPIIFILFHKKKKLLIVAMIIASLSLFYNFSSGINNYFSTIGNTIYLMIGCIGAIIFNSWKKYFYFLHNKLIKKVVVLTVLVLFLIRLKFPIVQFLILPLFFTLLIINEILSNSDNKTNIFTKLGKYTYGMYIFHPLIILLVKIFMDKLSMDYNFIFYYNALLIIVSFALTIVISIFSYKYFEKPFLKLKSKF